MTFSRALVEITLDLAAQFTVDFFRNFAVGFGRQAAQGSRVFMLETQQHLFRQRIHQAERDEIGGPFAFDVGQVAARVNAGAQRVG